MKLVDISNFEKDVLEEDRILVDFYADWCGPCRMIGPFLEEIQSEMGIKMVKVNIDESPEIASNYGVMSIPTLIIFKNGEKISTNVGAASKARLIDWIKSNFFDVSPTS
jgi:thioredoxin 1